MPDLAPAVGGRVVASRPETNLRRVPSIHIIRRGRALRWARRQRTPGWPGGRPEGRRGRAGSGHRGRAGSGHQEAGQEAGPKAGPGRLPERVSSAIRQAAAGVAVAMAGVSSCERRARRTTLRSSPPIKQDDPGHQARAPLLEGQRTVPKTFWRILVSVTRIDAMTTHAIACRNFGFARVARPERAVLGEPQVEREEDVHEREAHERHRLPDLLRAVGRLADLDQDERRAAMNRPAHERVAASSGAG